METKTEKLLNVNMTPFTVNSGIIRLKCKNCWICGNTDNLYINPKYKLILCNSCYNYHYQLYQ